MPAAVLRHSICRSVCVLLPAVGRTGYRLCRVGPGRDNCGHCDCEQHVPTHDSSPLDQSCRKMSIGPLSNRSLLFWFLRHVERTVRDGAISQNPRRKFTRCCRLMPMRYGGEPCLGLAAPPVLTPRDRARVVQAIRRITWNGFLPRSMAIVTRSRLIVDVIQVRRIKPASIRSKRQLLLYRSGNFRRYRAVLVRGGSSSLPGSQHFPNGTPSTRLSVKAAAGSAP
jgi:hypothetical protein